MRGRLQALVLVVIGSGSTLFCWISAAVLALVTLRKGVGMGVQFLLWALLPSGLLLYTLGDSTPLALLSGTALLAAVLRLTVNLPLAVLASIAVGVLSGLALLAFDSQFLEQVLKLYGEFLASLERQLAEGGNAVQFAQPTAAQLAGLMGAGNGMLAVLCLMLARYWQAALYNPGGFGAEFRALRYTPPASLAMVAAAAVLYGFGVTYRTWAVIALLPLNFAGIALVHARVRSRGGGAAWLTGFYVAWLLLDPVKLVVVFAALADSWLDFRRRWGAGTDVTPRDDEQ